MTHHIVPLFGGPVTPIMGFFGGPAMRIISCFGDPAKRILALFGGTATRKIAFFGGPENPTMQQCNERFVTLWERNMDFEAKSKHWGKGRRGRSRLNSWSPQQALLQHHKKNNECAVCCGKGHMGVNKQIPFTIGMGHIA
jgi:hypothetical protein